MPTIIILNWNGSTLLQRCLPALLAQDYPAFRVVVVDNASTDDSVAVVRRDFPQVEVIENQVNLGFAGGNNVALRRLETDVAVLLNPDVIVEPGWLRALVGGLLADESIGIAGGKLFYPATESGQRRLQHAGGAIHFPQAMPGYHGLDEDEAQHNARRDVDYVVGASLAVRRSLLEKIGLLDEGFFLYFEDADLCFRARRAGYRVVYVPDAVALHEESVLTGKESLSYLTWFHSSRWRFLLKHATAEQLLQETVPAERAWLPQTGGRVSLARAYAHTLRTLHQALAARQQHGAPAFDDAATEQLATALAELRQEVWRLQQSTPTAQLQAHATLQRFQFRSRVPLLGPLLAGLRNAWSRVATRPVVDPIAAQQEAFNQALLQHLADKETRLAAYDARHATAARELSAQREQLAQMVEALRVIDGRLERMEIGD